MRTQESYESVFSPLAPLGVWVAITEVLKTVDEHLSAIRGSVTGEGERFLASWRNLVAFLAVSRLLGTFDFSNTALIGFQTSHIDLQTITEVWQLIERHRGTKPKPKDYQRVALIMACCEELFQTAGITGMERVGKRSPIDQAYQFPARRVDVTDEFIQEVNRRLPEQPWKPGTHLLVIEALGCSKRELASAVDHLIERGERFRQQDGVLYDLEGKVVGFDPDRVSDPRI